jgi:heme-degrading monooxygenase HmoA
MYARYMTLRGRCRTYRGAPSRIDAVLERMDGQDRAVVEATEGNRGLAVLADAEGGRILGASYWDCAESLQASEEAPADARADPADARADLAKALSWHLTVERFEVIVGIRRSITARGAPVRLSRFEMDRSRVEEAIALFWEETVPRVKGADGLCSFQLLLDRESGSGMVATAWESERAAEAFWPTAEQLRAVSSERVGLRFSPPDTYAMARTTVRLD